MTPDPIGLDGGINLFNYASNNPINLIDPDGLAGIAIEAGGGAGTIFTGSDTAGSGIYLGVKKSGYAEIGAFSNVQKAIMKILGKVGLGVDLTAYFIDAENFFKGKTYFKTWTFGPASYTKFYDKCENQIGVQVSLWSLGGGLGKEKGVSEGHIYPLQ